MSRLVYDEQATHLLKENYYQYTVQDVAEPNLFPEVFNYEQVPKVAFNQRVVPLCMPEDICITDTTFRDGQQAREPFTASQIVKIFDLLHRLNGRSNIVRQSEFFVYSEQDRRALELCQDRNYLFPEITTWIRATEKDFDLVKALGVKETGILVSCSDFHIFKKLNMTRKQAMEQYLSVVKMALDRGIKPRCHFEDLTRADFYGFVVPFAHALNDLGEEAGIPIKIRICDTLGLGVSYPGASLPRSVPGIIYGLRHYADVDSSRLEWHGHNDFYKVVSNAATAWLYGCGAVNTTILGIGERTGNCPLEAMVMEYCSLRGDAGGMDLSVLTEMANYFSNELGYAIPPMTPFMGRDFCVTRAGIHADGLAKFEQIYSIFDTKRILDRPNRVMLDAHSGLAGVAYWLNHCGLLSAPVQKTDALTTALKEKVDALYAQGRTTFMSDEELENMTRELMAAEGK